MVIVKLHKPVMPSLLALMLLVEKFHKLSGIDASIFIIHPTHSALSLADVDFVLLLGMSLFCFFLTYFSFQQFFYLQPIFLIILLEIYCFAQR